MLGDQRYSVSKSHCADGATLYSFSSEAGDSQMKVYHLSPGIKLTYHAIHADRSYFGAQKKENVIEIHHCREGRMECACNGEYFYLMPGDLAIESTRSASREFIFPLHHYHGITITINTDIAPRCFSCFLKDVNVQPLIIAEKLCKEATCFIIRSKSYIEHIFSEMYSIPCSNSVGYYKIKLLELMLVLSGIDPEENRISTHTLSSTQVELAKRVAAYISANHDSRMTVAFLAKNFHVSATHLQNAFKGVFGVPVFSYIRIDRMNAAALQLVQTDKTVMEIASESGYDNASKFAAAFCEIMKENPLEYRKAHRALDS